MPIQHRIYPPDEDDREQFTRSNYKADLKGSDNLREISFNTKTVNGHDFHEVVLRFDSSKQHDKLTAIDQLKEAGYKVGVENDRLTVERKADVAIGGGRLQEGESISPKDFGAIADSLARDIPGPNQGFQRHTLSDETAAHIASTEMKRCGINPSDIGMVDIKEERMSAERRQLYAIHPEADVAYLKADIKTPTSLVKGISESGYPHAALDGSGKTVMFNTTHIDIPDESNRALAALQKAGIKAEAHNVLDKQGHLTGKGYITADAPAEQVAGVLKDAKLMPAAIADEIIEKATALHPGQVALNKELTAAEKNANEQHMAERQVQAAAHTESNHAEPAVAGEEVAAPARGRMGALADRVIGAAHAVGDAVGELASDKSGKVRNPLANIGKKTDNSREANAPQAAAAPAPAQPAPQTQTNGGAETPPPAQTTGSQTPPAAEAGIARAGGAAEGMAEAVDRAAEAASHAHGRGGLLGLAVGGLFAFTEAAANDASASEVAKAGAKGVAGGILPGATEGFKNITQNNEHQNWVDQALNGADTVTQGTAMTFLGTAGASSAVALGATALAPVTGGASLAVTAVAGAGAAGSMVVSAGAAAANIGVGLVHDVTYATGLSKEGGIITGMVEAGGGLAHSRVADRMEDWVKGNNSAVREELAAKGVTQEQLHKVEASLHKDGTKVSAQDTRDYLEAHNVSVADVNKLDAKGLGDKMAALLASDELKAAKAACSTATHCDTPSAPLPGGVQKQHAAANLVG